MKNSVTKVLLSVMLIFVLSFPFTLSISLAATDADAGVDDAEKDGEGGDGEEGAGDSEAEAKAEADAKTAEVGASAAAEAAARAAERGDIKGAEVSSKSAAEWSGKANEAATAAGTNKSIDSATVAQGAADKAAKSYEAAKAVNEAKTKGVSIDAKATVGGYISGELSGGKVKGANSGAVGTVDEVAQKEIAHVFDTRAVDIQNLNEQTKSSLFSPTSLTTSAAPLTTAKDLGTALSSLLDPTPISYQNTRTSISLPGVATVKEVAITSYNYDKTTNSFVSEDGKTLDMSYMDAVVSLTQMKNPYGTLKNNTIDYDVATESFVFTDSITNVKTNVPVNSFSPINSMIQARTTLNQQIPSISYTEDELDMAVRAALAEAKAIADETGVPQDAALQQALEVMRNRVMSDNFPNNLTDVINQENQFEVVSNDSINNQPTSGPQYDQAQAIAKAVFDGVAPAIAVDQQGFGHTNFGNIGTIQGRPTNGSGVTASEDTKTGFSQLGSYDDTLHTADVNNPNTWSHTSGFYGGVKTGAPDFTTGYSVTKPDFTAAVNMGRNAGVSTGDIESTPSTDEGNVATAGIDDSTPTETEDIAKDVVKTILDVACKSSLCGKAFDILDKYIDIDLGSWTGGARDGGTGGGHQKCQRGCLYPLSPSGQPALAIEAAQGLIQIFSKWRHSEVSVETIKADEDYVIVLLIINDRTQKIEIVRPDIVNALAANTITGVELEQLRRLLNETAILFSDTGSVLYSNGLYSPPVTNGVSVDANAPKYVYVTKRIDENGNIVEMKSGTTPDDTLLKQALRQILRSSSPFVISEVTDVRYRLINPDRGVASDEYYDFVVTLNDGSKRANTIPQFSSVQVMNERFGQIGFQGQALSLLAIAHEDKSEPPQGLLNRLLSWGAQIVGINNETGETYTDVADAVKTGKWNADNIESVFIYPNADVSCYEDASGYESGFLYTALLRDEDNLYVITEGLCGDTSTSTLAITTSARLAGQFGISGIDYNTIAERGYIVTDRVSETDVRPGITKLYLPAATSGSGSVTEPISTTTTPVDDTEPKEEDEKLPNTTNTVSFEVKAVGSGGNVLADWTNSSSLTITEGVQLYFRWNASDYQQCLPFLQDNGNYSLTRSNRAMTSGNTESESYDVTEKTATYRLECGGQKNKEIGVDAREIGVVVK